MKKMSLFLFGVMLAMGNGVSAMNNKSLSPEDVYEEFLKTLRQDDKVFLFDMNEQGEKEFKKNSPFWKDSQLNEIHIKKIIDEISDKNVVWGILLRNTNSVNDNLIAMMYFTFRKDSKEENIKKNQKSLLRLADVLRACIDRHNMFEKQLNRDLLDVIFAVPLKTSPLLRRIELVREFYCNLNEKNVKV